MKVISNRVSGALIHRNASVESITAIAAEPKLRFHQRNSRQRRYQLEQHLLPLSQRLGKHLDLEV